MASYYDRLMLGAHNSVDDYWRQVSCGAINLAGSKAFGWFDLGKPSTAYHHSDTGQADLESFARDCATAASAQAGKDLAFADYVGLNLVFSSCIDRPRGGAIGLWVDGRFRNYRITWLCPGYASSHRSSLTK